MKTKNIQRYILLLALNFLLLSTSCIDEKLIMEDPQEELLEDYYYLGLNISLPSLSGTRAAQSQYEEYDDYIDPRKLSLLFFYGEKDKDENPLQKYNTLIKQFEPSDLSFIPIESTIDGTVRNWHVRLKSIDEDFADKLRNNYFKVAVLANWKNIPSLSEETGDIPGDKIKKLHHVQDDNSTYGKDALKFLFDGYVDDNNKGLMGDRLNWVQNEFTKAWYLEEGQNSAEYWIRKNWTDEDKIEENRRNYGDLWLIWNFDAAYHTLNGMPATGSFTFEEGNGKGDSEEYWAYKNYDDLHTWLISRDGKLTGIGPIDSDHGGFKFTGEANLYNEPGKVVGVKMIAGTYQTNVFTFNLNASARVTVKWKKANSDGDLKIERRNYTSDTTAKSDTRTESGPDSNGMITTYYDFGITGDTEFAYIYSPTGNVIIYEIEYIAAEYLYGIKRNGVYPTQAQGIPMYGIQSYSPLDGFWTKGTVFNLSDYNNLSVEGEYNYKDISLLRSVAKVELKIPKNLNPQYVYLRSLNRQARSEPMDVSTPTDQIWNPHTVLNNEINCEWNGLIGHRPFYFPPTNNGRTDYMENLAWYYGSWQENKLIGGQSVPVKDKYGDNLHTVDGYPHIINPRIERSDFVEFINTGESEGLFERYILYVPDKFVDDPNDITKSDLNNQNPKVCHIEFRRGKDKDGKFEDPFFNLDDNNCYRIYFTKDGFYSGTSEKPNNYPTFTKPENASEYDTWENSYEQKVENLLKHWPIMRNHVYSFTVIDATQKVVILDIQVLPWKETDQNVYNW